MLYEVIADFGAAVQVARALAQDLPAFLLFRIALAGPVDPELVGAVERGFNPQHAALFVVELDRVAVGLVFETQSFRALFEAAQDLTLEIAMHPAVGLDLVASYNFV